MLDFVARGSASPTPSPSLSSEPAGHLFGLDFTDGVGWIAVGVALLLAVGAGIRRAVTTARQSKDEARLVTSDFRFLAGLDVPATYEVTVHNATPHPLSMVEIRYWNGMEWRPMPARSPKTGDVVIQPGESGIGAVPAMTTDLKEFNTFYFLRYTDSRNRTWNRRIKNPDFLSRGETKQLERFHGTI